MIHHEEVWGTVVALELYEESKSISEIETVSKEAVSFLHEIDRDFSTFKVDSEVSQIRRGTLKIENASAKVQLIWKLCEEARALTEGAFDPWHARLGGFDPSGYVKGWAADQIANMSTTQLQQFNTLQIRALSAEDIRVAATSISSSVSLQW